MKIRFIDPAEDFTDRLAVIFSYHASFLSVGRQLLELIPEIAQEIDEARALRLAEIYAFYQRANFLHHLDEERALFPRMVGQDLMLDGMIERLALDHEEIEEAWRVLDLDLKEILTHHRVPEAIAAKAVRFEQLQRAHLERENEDFLPRLEVHLTPIQRQQIAAAMARMRGQR